MTRIAILGNWAGGSASPKMRGGKISGRQEGSPCHPAEMALGRCQKILIFLVPRFRISRTKDILLRLGLQFGGRKVAEKKQVTHWVTWRRAHHFFSGLENVHRRFVLPTLGGISDPGKTI
jgi:hypothetical protein